MSTSMSVFSMDDEQREQRRQHARRELAKIAITKTRIAELRRQLESIEADSDKAADSHGATTAPIQAELVKIQAEQVAAIASGKKVSDKSEKRRRELLAELDEANAELELVTERNKALAKNPKQELAKLQSETVHSQSLQNSIVQHGSDENLDLAWQHQQNITWANSRLESARNHFAASSSGLTAARQRRDSQAVQLFSRRARRWQLEMRTAENGLAAAMAESETHRQKMLDA